MFLSGWTMVSSGALTYSDGVWCANITQQPALPALGQDAPVIDVSCQAQGQLIWLVMPGAELSLCDVKVFAEPAVSLSSAFPGISGTHYESTSNCLATGLGSACGCGLLDTDTDGDGAPDCIDQCPNDPLKSLLGTCGCGESEDDSDGDGTKDCIDQCPLDPSKTRAGICGCGVPETDDDSDGTPNCNDNCHGLQDSLGPGSIPCGFIAGLDSDNDGTLDYQDFCPYETWHAASNVPTLTLLHGPSLQVFPDIS